ncbi:MAG TPA: hypothetical protein VJ717_16305 [Gemmatimonadaceae bacterium]|nr:hypothetical protein [Gemmatimonadaceae bacterium]
MTRTAFALFGVLLGDSAVALAAQSGTDTSAVIAEVAGYLQREETRTDSLRKAACTSGTPSLCRSAAKIERIIWYVRENLALAASLAQQVGASAKPADTTTLPPCPWPAVLESGYSTTLKLEFAGDSAVVTLTRECTNPRGYLHRTAWGKYEFTLERHGDGWEIKAARISAT